MTDKALRRHERRFVRGVSLLIALFIVVLCGVVLCGSVQMVFASYLGHTGQGLTDLLHGDSQQFMVQLGGATLCAVWAFAQHFSSSSVTNKIKPIRVTAEAEERGLDVPEFGMVDYPEDALVTVDY
jgi:ammonia channel protein AmtB